MKTIRRLLSVGAVLAFAITAPVVVHAQAAPDEQVARYLQATRAPLIHPATQEQPRRVRQEIGKRADGSPLVIDLTLPKPGGKAGPAVVLLHGGLPDEAPIRPSAWRVYNDWGAALAAEGTVGIMFDHSLGFPKQRLDQAMGEVDQVLAWIVKDGPAFGIDAAHVQTWSFSAGGLLTAELLDDKRPLRLAGMVLFYPLTGLPPDGPSLPLVGPVIADRMDLAKNAERVAKANVPMVIYRAGHDEVPGLLPLLDRSLAALLAADARVEIINLPGAPHSFDFLTDTPRVRGSINRALRFAAPG